MHDHIVTAAVCICQTHNLLGVAFEVIAVAAIVRGVVPVVRVRGVVPVVVVSVRGPGPAVGRVISVRGPVVARRRSGLALAVVSRGGREGWSAGWGKR